MSAAFCMQGYIQRVQELLTEARVSSDVQERLMQVLLEVEIDAGYLEERRSNVEHHFGESLKVIKNLESLLEANNPELIPKFIKPAPPVYNTKYLTWPKIGIAASELGGKGVFALTTISSGEVIELVPAITCKRETLNASALIDYYFNIEDEKNDECAVALGWGSVYNHSDTPSANWILDPAGQEIAFIALREICADEEITINYGSSYWTSARRAGTKKVYKKP